MPTTHQGHIEIDGAERGATLTIKPGRARVVIALPNASPMPPQRIELLRFTSSSGYFTLLHLDRREMTSRLGVAGLATYDCWLAIESGHFQSLDEIRSRTWSVQVRDVAKVLHVNGVRQELSFADGGADTVWVIAPAPAVEVPCPDTGITLRFGQSITHSGNPIDGPKLTLSYPIEIAFEEAADPERAVRTMHRIRQLLSMLMGRILPIDEALVTFEIDDRPHVMPVHGILLIEGDDRPNARLIPSIDAAELARLMNTWLARYDELEDAIRLHTSGLGPPALPTELRFQIFVQALEALHRRTQANGTPIDLPPVIQALRDNGVASDVVGRVRAMLSRAHEPSLAFRLDQLWPRMATELEVVRPGLNPNVFIGQVAATRNHYAHRTEVNTSVMQRADLWNGTEIVKAITHMALLLEIGANIGGMGQEMRNRKFVEFAVPLP